MQLYADHRAQALHATTTPHGHRHEINFTLVAKYPTQTLIGKFRIDVGVRHTVDTMHLHAGYDVRVTVMHA